MNIKTLFKYEKQDGRAPRITASEKLFSLLSDVLDGKKAKYMSDLAKSFSYTFRRMNLQKGDPLPTQLYLLARNLRLQPSPENIKTLIYKRSVINHILAQYRGEEPIIFNLLFENCFNLVFKSNNREEIAKRSSAFRVFLEEILLHLTIQ